MWRPLDEKATSLYRTRAGLDPCHSADGPVGAHPIQPYDFSGRVHANAGNSYAFGRFRRPGNVIFPQPFEGNFGQYTARG